MAGEQNGKATEALACFSTTFNCAQAVFSTFAPDLGLDRECALKAATAFGGGLAGTGATCGAVTGALMAIGLARGMIRPEDTDAKEETYRLTRVFMERFKALHFTTLCRELLGCDLSTPEGMAFLKENNLKEKLCAGFVRDAADNPRGTAILARGIPAGIGTGNYPVARSLMFHKNQENRGESVLAA